MIPTLKEFQRREWHIPLTLLMLAAFLLYAGSFGAEWSHDDFPVIVDNPDIRSLSAFFKDTYPGRPLREFTFLFDYQLFGLKPAGYHIQNIFWHAFNAFLLFLLSMRLGVARWGAWLVSLLFLTHPLQVEVVANSSHRKDSLALAFCLLALLAWVRGREKGFNSLWLGLGVLFAAIAMLAKQNAVVLPAIILGYELLFCGGWGRLRENGRLLAAVGLTGAGCGWFVIDRYLAGFNIRGTMAAMLAAKAGLNEGFSVAVYYATVVKSWFFNWSRLLWPRDLAIEYHVPAAMGFGEPQVIAAGTSLVLLLLGIILCWRRVPAASFGFGWFLLFWLPTSNLIPQVYFAADRYMYAPSAGAFLAIAALADRLPVQRWVYRSAAGLAVLSLALLAWQQIGIWSSVKSLWTQAVKVSPESSFALNNLGSVYFLDGELLKAKELYERSVVADPVNPTAFYNLGLIYEKVGDFPKALSYYKKFQGLQDPAYSAERRALTERLGLSEGASIPRE